MSADPGGSRAPGVAAYFDSVAGIWSRNYSPAGSMAERVDRFVRVLEAAGCDPASRVLDFGCGSGDITRALAARGYAMTGADISAGMLARAREAPGADAVEWTALDPRDGVSLPFPPGRFDAVLSSSVLEYVDAPERLIARLADLVRPGGLLAFTVPDMRDPGRQEESRWLRKMDRTWWRALLALAPARLPARVRREYLKQSVQRVAPGRWLEWVRDAGLVAMDPPACTGPLLMVTARRSA